MMKDTFQLGLIGCGEIAQIMHLPHISSIEGVTVRAIADISKERVEQIDERYNIPNRYEEGSRLIEEQRDEIDGLVVCTPPHTHTELGVQTLNAGLPLFIEKPLAVTPDDAQKLTKRAQKADVTTMVGYMKRYDPAYQLFQETVKKEETIRYVDAYDVDPMHPRIIQTMYDIVPGSIPETVAEDSDQRRTKQAKEAVGVDSDFLADNYLYHLEHICHDVNLLYGLFGKVVEIEHVSLGSDGAFLTTELRYENSNKCHLVSGRTNREWFEEYIRIDTPEQMLRIDFSNPYIRDSPTEVTVKTGTDEVEKRTQVPTTEEPFKREIRAFVESIHGEKENLTPFEDAAQDVELVSDIFKEVQKR